MATTSKMLVLRRKLDGHDHIVPLDKPATFFGRSLGKQLMQHAVKLKYVTSLDEMQYVQLAHTDISRVHAKIIIRDGSATLCDLNETNGSCVIPVGSSDKITVMKSNRELQPGDTIMFAPDVERVHSFVYVLELRDNVDRENIPEFTHENGFHHKAIKAPSESAKRKRANSSLTKLFTTTSQSIPQTEMPAQSILKQAAKDSHIERMSSSPKQMPQLKRLKPSERDSFEGNTSAPTITTTTYETPEKSAPVSKIKNTPPPQKEVTSQVSVIQENFSEEFNCVVCMELLIPPCIATNCGHNFCEYCIDTWMYKFRKEEQVKCPTCNEVILHRVRLYAVANCIEKIEQKMCPAEKADRDECRASRLDEIATFEEQKKKDTEAEEREKLNKSDDTDVNIFANLNLVGYHLNTQDTASDSSKPSSQSSPNTSLRRRSRRKKSTTAPPTRTIPTRKRSSRAKK